MKCANVQMSRKIRLACLIIFKLRILKIDIFFAYGDLQGVLALHMCTFGFVMVKNNFLNDVGGYGMHICTSEHFVQTTVQLYQNGPLIQHMCTSEHLVENF